MPMLRNGSKGDSNAGSLDCESGILTRSSDGSNATIVVSQALKCWSSLEIKLLDSREQYSISCASMSVPGNNRLPSVSRGNTTPHRRDTWRIVSIFDVNNAYITDTRASLSMCVKKYDVTTVHIQMWSPCDLYLRNIPEVGHLTNDLPFAHASRKIQNRKI